MVEQARNAAKYAAIRGREHQADAWIRTVKILEEAGVPARLPLEAFGQFAPSETGAIAEREVGRLVIGAFFDSLHEDEIPSNNSLTNELAQGIQRRFGQFLSDETPLAALKFPGYDEKRALPQEEEDMLDAIPRTVKMAYNKTIISFISTAYGTDAVLTVGELRKMSKERLQRKRGVGPRAVRFFKTAFAKPE